MREEKDFFPQVGAICVKSVAISTDAKDATPRRTELLWGDGKNREKTSAFG